MNNIIIFRAPAKINLTLDVFGRDPSGYHRIQTIYHEVPELFDELEFTPLKGPQILFECDEPRLPLDESNTVVKAAKLLQKKYKPPKGVKIHLRKKIPIASGLGGGSSDAAITLKALNQLWQLPLSREQLFTHAVEIGMDVPFFILGGCALGMHYGEQLMPLAILQTVPGYEAAKIEVKVEGPPVSTVDAYRGLDLSRCGQQSRDTSTLVKILKGEKVGTIDALLHNDFKTTDESPWHLSGSGGAQFRGCSKSWFRDAKSKILAKNVKREEALSN